jgi:hypothetical protein
MALHTYNDNIFPFSNNKMNLMNNNSKPSLSPIYNKKNCTYKATEKQGVKNVLNLLNNENDKENIKNIKLFKK